MEARAEHRQENRLISSHSRMQHRRLTMENPADVGWNACGKEDTALKAYFKQQGLSQQEVEQAIATFKEQKAANQPNVEALQQQAATAVAEARQAQIQQAATMAAVGLGISVTSIPYLLKMADFSQAVGQDGKISNEKLTEALNKVLEDIPALKPQETDTTGFLHVGTGGDPSQHTQQATVQQQQTPTKRWNRWN